MALGYKASHRKVSALPIVEGAVVIQAMLLGSGLQLPGESSVLLLFHGIVFGCLMLLAMTSMGLYDANRGEPFRHTAQRLLMAYVTALILLTAVFFILPGEQVNREVFVSSSVFGLISLMLIRFTTHVYASFSQKERRVLVIGSADVCKELQQVTAQHTSGQAGATIKLIPITSLVPGPDWQHELSQQELTHLAKQHQISDIVSATNQPGEATMNALLQLRLAGHRVWDQLSFYEREFSLIKLDKLETGWLVFGRGFDQSTARSLVKRGFDLICSSVLLLLSLPVAILAAIAIFIESGRPVFFRQTRTGEFSEPYQMLKFRSMRVDAEGDGTPRWAEKNDDRITPVGRFLRATRIDELPQLINVFRGEMSFVGPRPERPYFVEQLNEKIPFYDIRHNVPPGVTGWAQVRLPYGNTSEASAAKLEYDLYYVKNHSLVFDLIILFETIRVVLRRKGQ